MLDENIIFMLYVIKIMSMIRINIDVINSLLNLFRNVLINIMRLII